MDIGDALLTAAISTGVAAAVAEWRSRAAESRAKARESESRRRDQLRKAVDDTEAAARVEIRMYLLRASGQSQASEDLAAHLAKRPYLHNDGALLGADRWAVLQAIEKLSGWDVPRTGSVVEAHKLAAATEDVIWRRAQAQRQRIEAGLEPERE
jgi:hypothetical protein